MATIGLRAGHRVEERRAEPLGHRAHDEQIEALEATEDVGAEAGQQHVLFELVLAHLPLELLAQLAFTQNDEARVRHLPDDEVRGLDQVTVPFVRHQRGDIADDRRAVGQPECLVDVDGRRRQHMVDVDALVHRHRAVGWHAVADEHPPDGFRGGDEAVDLPVLPAGERIALEMKIHAAGRDKRGCGGGRPEGQRERRHCDAVRVVRVNDVGLQALDDP